MLLINNHQTQILKVHARLNQSVGANDNVDCAGRHFVSGDLLFFLGLETGNRFYGYGPVGEPILEGIIVLLSEECRRY